MQKPDFFQGAQMAYEDCASIVEKMAANLPDNLKFLEGGFNTLSVAMRAKINLMILMLEQNGETKQ